MDHVKVGFHSLLLLTQMYCLHVLHPVFCLRAFIGQVFSAYRIAAHCYVLQLKSSKLHFIFRQFCITSMISFN